MDIRIQKSTRVPPKVLDPPKRNYHSYVSCRRCGHGITEAHWRYCPNCGQAVAHFSYAGTHGWTHRTSEQVYRSMIESLDKAETEGADDNAGNALRDSCASG